MRNADRSTATLLLLGAVAFSAGALKYYGYWGEGGPGPAFLPFWLGVLMALLSGAMLVRSLREREAGGAWLAQGEARSRVLVVIAASVLFVVLLKVLGMVVASVLYLAFLMRYLERNPWPLTLGVSAAAAGINYVVFVRWLHVPFPEGFLGF